MKKNLLGEKALFKFDKIDLFGTKYQIGIPSLIRKSWVGTEPVVNKNMFTILKFFLAVQILFKSDFPSKDFPRQKEDTLV